ncbi:hypothetical protein ES703_94291 [subsurface metagenome]
MQIAKIPATISAPTKAEILGSIKTFAVGSSANLGISFAFKLRLSFITGI